MGSTWFNLGRDLDSAGHVLGKLLTHLGPERILWGTDSIWYGSPQGQIDAFRAFEITPEAQERYGYPALTTKPRTSSWAATPLASTASVGLPGCS